MNRTHERLTAAELEAIHADAPNTTVGREYWERWRVAEITRELHETREVVKVWKVMYRDLKNGSEASQHLARAKGLAEALREACDEFEDASQYKGEYLAKKHGDADTLKRLRNVLAGRP